ncbi:helix-turn-helix domain-containing protein [Plantactinospora sp. WMMB334]|uniref:helix-turn-helix domain-containing protein n=1 Tax=Plantactinospora sp. WMMB334 TaxID=3404119 RepID=UPI003B924F5B
METFGVLLRRLRTAAGMSLRDLSRKVNYDHSYLSQIERGAKPPTPVLAAACDRALDSGGMLVEAYERHAGEVDMQRRTVLRALSGLAASAPVLTQLEALRHGMGAAIGADADEWQQVVADYGYAFYRQPHALLMEQLTSDLTVLQTLIANTTGARRARLSDVAAHLSVVAAALLFAGGQAALSQRWQRTARQAAADSHDSDTAVKVRAQEIVNGCYDGQDPQAVLRLSEEAVSLAAGRVSPAVANLHGGRAQLLAMQGRAEEARAEMRRVVDITAQLPAVPAGEDDSLWIWPEQRLRHTESFVYTHIGDTSAASAAQDRAVALYPSSQARLRTQVELHRACGLIRDGYIPDGLRHAADVLDRLPAEQHTDTLRSVAHQVLAAVPEREMHRPAVTDLRARIITTP